MGAMATETRGYTADKEQLLKRLARIKGQVGGIERMVEEDRYCIDVLTQIAAVEAALDKVALRLREALDPQPGEVLLEVGPGTGYYALDVAGWIAPGTLHVFDLQQEMLDHTH